MLGDICVIKVTTQRNRQ